jgi:hypothetical protein
MVKGQVTTRNNAIKRSAISEIVGDEDPAAAIGRILGSREPSKGYRQIASTAKRSGPEAVEGLKTATLENVARTSGNSMDVLFRSSDDAMKMMVNSGVMSASEAGRLRNVLKRASTIERNMSNVTGRAGDIGDGPETFELMDTMIRIQGAKMGAFLAGKTTGAQLVAAGKGSQFLQNVLEKNPFFKTVEILSEAAANPKLMADLMKKHAGPEATRSALLRIRGSLVAAGIAPAELKIDE